MQEQILTAQHVQVNLELAGIGRRIPAALIDYVLLAGYLTLAFFGARLLEAGSTGTVLMFLPVLFYSLGCEVFFDGQTVGKYWCNIRVVTMDGGVPSLQQYLLRWILRPIDILLVSGAVAVVSIIVTRRSQRLGDLVAGTLVVREREGSAFLSQYRSPAREQHAVRYPQVQRLSDEDIATARAVRERLLAEGLNSDTAALCRRLQDVLVRKMGVSSDESPKSFVRTIIADHEALHNPSS